MGSNKDIEGFDMMRTWRICDHIRLDSSAHNSQVSKSVFSAQ